MTTYTFDVQPIALNSPNSQFVYSIGGATPVQIESNYTYMNAGGQGVNAGPTFNQADFKNTQIRRCILDMKKDSVIKNAVVPPFIFNDLIRPMYGYNDGQIPKYPTDLSNMKQQIELRAPIKATTVTWSKINKIPNALKYRNIFIESGKNPNDFLKDPINILRLFEEGLKTGLLIHQDAMRVVTANLHKITPKIRKNPETQRIFMSLLLDFGNPERALRRMNELGVLGAVIPEFKRIIALMQFNFYHSYTVDEHTIQCVSFLAKIEQGTLKEELPIASDILKSGVDRRVLFTAMLLHDIGKGLPEDHSIAGARLAAQIAPELGLSETETEKVVWLVENHLLMSDFAQKRDLSDPKTVSNFASKY